MDFTSCFEANPLEKSTQWLAFWPGLLPPYRFFGTLIRAKANGPHQPPPAQQEYRHDEPVRRPHGTFPIGNIQHCWGLGGGVMGIEHGQVCPA
jgi:hypothetical protein